MGKGEIARYEQFLLFPQCFQKACFPGASKGVIVWEWGKEQFFATLGTHKLSFCEECINVFAMFNRRMILQTTSQVVSEFYCASLGLSV